MQIVIDIPEDLKKMIFDDEVFDIANSYRLAMCVKNGTPLPKEQEPCEELDFVQPHKKIAVNLVLCEDCISRQAAIDLANELKDDLPDDERISDMVMSHNEGILEYQTKLSLLPPVTPAEKVGRWVLRNDINGQYQCEECGMFTGLDRFDVKEGGFELPKYCSNCGRRNMEAKE